MLLFTRSPPTAFRGHGAPLANLATRPRISGQRLLLTRVTFSWRVLSFIRTRMRGLPPVARRANARESALNCPPANFLGFAVAARCQHPIASQFKKQDGAHRV